MVLKNTQCGVEEHRVQACNEVVWAITRSVRVQPFMTRTIVHHTHGPVGSIQQYGCRNEERNTHARQDQSVVVGKNGGISWIDDYFMTLATESLSKTTKVTEMAHIFDFSVLYSSNSINFVKNKNELNLSSVFLSLLKITTML